MPHLPAERLAALADDAPLHAAPPRDDAHGVVVSINPMTAEEAEHLAACPDCAHERDAYRTLLAVAGDERARLAPPLTSWGAIAAQLREEGLMLAGADDATNDSAIPALRFPAIGGSLPLGRRRASMASRWGRRAAAAALFVVGGAIAGRASAGLPPLGLFDLGRAAARDSVRVASNAVAGGAAATTASDAQGGIGRLVGNDTMTAFRDTIFRSTTDALVALARAEHDYQVAAAYLLAHDSSTSGARTGNGGDAAGVYRARLAALDNVMAASREALYEAPHDPVINRYYLATVGAREATLQQLNTALPAGARVTRF